MNPRNDSFNTNPLIWDYPSQKGKIKVIKAKLTDLKKGIIDESAGWSTISSSLLCLLQPKIVCWSSHMKTKVTLYYVKSLILTTLTSMLTPEIWFMFCLYSTFASELRPEFISSNITGFRIVTYVQVEVTSSRRNGTSAFQNKRQLIWYLSLHCVTIYIYEWNV